MEKLNKIPHKFLFYFGFFIVLIFLSLSYWQFTSFQNDKITLNEFKNNNISILTSLILNLKDIDKGKISEIQKSAEEELGNSEISDQEKYLLDQKIEVLKSIN